MHERACHRVTRLAVGITLVNWYRRQRSAAQRSSKSRSGAVSLRSSRKSRRRFAEIVPNQRHQVPAIRMRLSTLREVALTRRRAFARTGSLPARSACALPSNGETVSRALSNKRRDEPALYAPLPTMATLYGNRPALSSALPKCRTISASESRRNSHQTLTPSLSSVLTTGPLPDMHARCNGVLFCNSYQQTHSGIRLIRAASVLLQLEEAARPYDHRAAEC